MAGPALAVAISSERTSGPSHVCSRQSPAHGKASTGAVFASRWRGDAGPVREAWKVSSGPRVGGGGWRELGFNTSSR